MKAPLVLNLTNYVAMNISANALLAVGASPLMSFYANEIEELTRKCDALVINIGCLDSEFSKAAIIAARTALECGKPWVLDPVGIGASKQRMELCRRLIEEFKPTIIRGNASEINSLLHEGQEDGGGRGVDATISSSEALEAAKLLASRTGAVISMSGASDYITNGTEVLGVEGGSDVMTRVTAMGCTASALTAAFTAMQPDPLQAAYAAMKLMAAAGEMAAARTKLPGSFQTEFIDALARLGRKRFDRKLLRLYLVTDRGLAGGRDIVEIASEAASGGATMVQLREKEIDTDRFIALAKELKKALQPLGVPLIINDRVDVALASDADGVHIGQSDMPYETARRLLGPDKIIGLSVENMNEVLEANALDVDYIGVSPVLATPTKTDTAEPFGFDGLKQAAGLSVHPAVAIGGMNERTAAQAIRSGADGIAVVSAIVRAPDPRKAAANLKKVMEDVA